jgi:hypothetical protein
MKIDRAAFLALTVSIASVACAAGTEETGSGTDDVVTGSAGCFKDGEEAAPIKEGVCFDLWIKAQEHEFKELTTPTGEGGTVAESLGCVASSPSHPAAEGAKVCETFHADFVLGRCQAYRDLYKKSSATAAVSCLQKLADLNDSMAVYNCGFDALAKSCDGQTDANETCTRVAASRAFAGKPLSTAEKKECADKVGGLRKVGRDLLVSTAEGGDFFSLHSALEGLDSPVSAPSFEGGPSTEGGPSIEGGPSVEGGR